MKKRGRPFKYKTELERGIARAAYMKAYRARKKEKEMNWNVPIDMVDGIVSLDIKDFLGFVPVCKYPVSVRPIDREIGAIILNDVVVRRIAGKSVVVTYDNK